MSVIQGNAIESGLAAYEIPNSLRFNSADSAYLSRTPASAGNRRVMTWNLWLKKSSIASANKYLFACNDEYIRFNDTITDTLRVKVASSNLITTQLFRDPSAWGMLTIAVDTTQATASNRVKVYWNGVQITAFGTETYPSQNADATFNTADLHRIGSYAPTAEGFYDGYMTEVNFIDGQALDPTSFGEYNSETGVWQPKAYTGSYGTNGFYLDFADNSSTTALGYDAAGSNDWTPNNFSVTAGAGNDSLVDTPTPYGTDTGVGAEVRGNYATLNPLSTSSASGTTPTNGNLDIGATSTACDYMTTMFVSSGKWYFEVLVNQVDTSTPSSNPSLGIQGQGFPTSGPKIQVDTSGALTVDGSTTGSSFFTYTNGDIIGVAFDMDVKKAWLSKNGTYYNSGDPAAGTNATGTWSAAGEVAAFIRTRGNASASFNAGQRPFAYTAPSGFKALCTTNLPDPAIADGSTAMNAVLYSGTGSARSVTGVGFAPDFTWIKVRSAAYDHQLYDTIRGAGKYLYSNGTVSEQTDINQLSSFDSDGFSLGSGVGTNESGQTFVSWNWKAGGTGVSNTAGSITSTVSANTTAGFSIVTYTGSGTGSDTIGHGLGAAPSWVITKNRSNTDNWIVYFAISGTKYYAQLNLTNAASSTTGYTSPTSTVFNPFISLGSGDNYVAYCFAPIAGFSAFGSFQGNGSSDGPFVYTGFRPRWLLLKVSSASDYGWLLYDSARNSYNVTDLNLRAQTSDAEGSQSANYLDFLSNGFKIRGTSSGSINPSQTIIYAAFAENPFKYSLGR